MRVRTLWLSGVLGLALGCAASRPPTSPSPVPMTAAADPKGRIPVRIDNQNYSDMDVYLLSRGTRVLLGSVTPNMRYTPRDTEMLLRAVYPAAGTGPRYFNSTFYVAPSGAGVWATGTNRWAAYLDGDRAPANPKVQALTRAVLAWMDRH